MKNLLILMAIGLLLASCGPPKKLDFEQQQLQDAKQACQQEATNMNPESPNSDNPYWNAYFVMCMNRFGYTDEQIRQLWY